MSLTIDLRHQCEPSKFATSKWVTCFYLLTTGLESLLHKTLPWITVGRTCFWQLRNFWQEHKRLEWTSHVQKLLHEDCFHIRYQMPLVDFEALVKLLGDGVPNIVQSKRRCVEPIYYPKMIVAIGIRVLAGGNYDDIMNTFGISKAGFYWTRNKFINAVLTCNSLAIGLPTTPVEWENTRKGFALKSVNQVLKGCGGAIDGFFQPTICPTLKQSDGFPRSYYSGH